MSSESLELLPKALETFQIETSFAVKGEDKAVVFGKGGNRVRSMKGSYDDGRVISHNELLCSAREIHRALRDVLRYKEYLKTAEEQ